jgi:hypothetical protein
MGRSKLATGHPEQGEALLLPVFGAAERSGWREAAACTELVIGLCAEARGEPERARERLDHAAGIADHYGIPAVGWEAHAAVARLADEPDEHRAAARAIVEHMTADLTDDALRAGLLERAKP